MRKLSELLWPALLCSVIASLSPSFAFGAHLQNGQPPAASYFPLWSLVPFLLMLVSIAVLPMAASQWWESNRNKTILSVGMSLPVLMVVLPSSPQLLWHSLLDYISFLTLLGSLFVISGGFYVKGEFAGTPLVNSCYFGIESLFTYVIG